MVLQSGAGSKFGPIKSLQYLKKNRNESFSSFTWRPLATTKPRYGWGRKVFNVHLLCTNKLRKNCPRKRLLPFEASAATCLLYSKHILIPISKTFQQYQDYNFGQTFKKPTRPVGRLRIVDHIGALIEIITGLNS